MIEQPIPSDQSEAETTGVQNSQAMHPSTASLSATLHEVRTTLRGIDGQLGAIENQLHSATQAISHHPYPSYALTSPWRLPAAQAWFLAAVFVIMVVALFVRLVGLESYQADVYGDISIVWEYMAAIQRGDQPTYFVLSAGPLYHYLITPIIALTGLSYLGLKLASVSVSLAVLLAIYALARRLLNDHFALLATAVAAVSSWLLVFSRLGNSQILVPLLATLSLWLLVRFLQTDRRSDLLGCALVAALGLYTYPQTFILPGVIFITMFCLHWTLRPIRRRAFAEFVVAIFLFALPFAWIVSKDPYNFFQGYIGGKLVSESNPFAVLLQNILSGLMSLHMRGDTIARSNPTLQPHLDVLSGLLFLAGIAFWLQPERRRLSPILLLPLVLLQLPAVLVLSQPNEVPSASRMIGAAPMAYIFVASGLWLLVQTLRRLIGTQIALVCCSLLLVGITTLNMQRYFYTYLTGLPYQSVAVGSLIAHYANSLPPDTHLLIVGCCWAHGMPEPPFVRLEMENPAILDRAEPQDLNCEWLSQLSAPTVLVWTFESDLPAPQLEPCRAWLPTQQYYAKGRPTFNAAPLRPNLASSQSTYPPP